MKCSQVETGLTGDDCGFAEVWILAGLERQCSTVQEKFVHVSLLLLGKQEEYGHMIMNLQERSRVYMPD